MAAEYLTCDTDRTALPHGLRLVQVLWEVAWPRCVVDDVTHNALYHTC
jgi:hypothetical protein